MSKKLAPRIVEIIFNTTYLAAGLALLVYYIIAGRFLSPAITLYTLLTLFLIVGDIFHLVPRIILGFRPNINLVKYLGFGKLLTSIGMSIFYVVLYFFHKEFYNYESKILDFTIAFILGLRITLLFMPANKWFKKADNVKWGIIRNIPLLFLGTILTILFAINMNDKSDIFSKVWLAIIISFACYIPVVLFTVKKPMVGMLMLPKTLSYLYIVILGISLI